MVSTEKAKLYKFVLHQSHVQSIPTTTFRHYQKSTLAYWRRQWFNIRQHIAHKCLLRHVIYRKFNIDFYMAMHISKFCIIWEICFTFQPSGFSLFPKHEYAFCKLERNPNSIFTSYTL